MIHQEREITQLSRALAECERERDALKAVHAEMAARNASIVLWCQGALKSGTTYEYRGALVVIEDIAKHIHDIAKDVTS